MADIGTIYERDLPIMAAGGFGDLSVREWQAIPDAIRMRAAIRHAAKQADPTHASAGEKAATGQESATKSEQEAKARGNGAECGKPATRRVNTIDGPRWL